MQQIHQYSKPDEQNKPRRVDDCLHLAVDRFAANPFDDGKNDFRAVERGDGQQIEHTARLTPIYAAISKNDCKPREAISLVRRIVVIGPPKAESPKLPVNSCPSTLKMVPPIWKE